MRRRSRSEKGERFNLVMIEEGIHLYPSRTQKLSPSSPKILGWRQPGKIGHCRFIYESVSYSRGLGLVLKIWPYGQAVKTSPFHGGNPGSIPGRVTIERSAVFEFIENLIALAYELRSVVYTGLFYYLQAFAYRRASVFLHY